MNHPASPLALLLGASLVFGSPLSALAETPPAPDDTSSSTAWTIETTSTAPAVAEPLTGMTELPDPTASGTVLSPALPSDTSSTVLAPAQADPAVAPTAPTDESTAETRPPPVEAASTTKPVPIDTPTSTVLCLSIIAPAPASGPEWIGILGASPSDTAQLVGWSLADAQGGLVKISSSTALLWDGSTRTLRYELRSARLNNGGDTVLLKDPAGTEFDRFVYPATDRDQRWFRDTCATPWRRQPEPVATPSPAAETVSSAEPTAAAPEPAESGPPVVERALPELPPAPIEDWPVAEADAPDPVDAPAAPATVFTRPEAGVLAPAAGAMIANPPAKPKAQQPAMRPARLPATKTDRKRTAVSVPKSTKATKAGPPSKKRTSSSVRSAASPARAIPLPMSSLIESPETRQGVRVRLSGRVASRPNLLAKNRFVLVNDDGRGLLVHANGKQPSPGIGRMVELTGTVYWNDDGLWLKQGTADRWNDTAKDEAPPTSTLPVRAADLVAPAAEDAWSRLRLEGKVGSVQKASFDLETDETSIRIRVPAKLGYRVQRLQRGDLVSVEGLLDLRGGDPVVIPQREEEIQVIQRFSPPPEPKNPPIERPWLPVGAAGGTLALSEGWRRLKERQKRLREDAAFRALLEKTGTA